VNFFGTLVSLTKSKLFYVNKGDNLKILMLLGHLKYDLLLLKEGHSLMVKIIFYICKL